MSDIISREQFREQMYHRCFEVDNDENMQRWDSGNWLRWKLFEEELEKAPSAEPKKGKWLLVGNQADVPDEIMCSCCGRRIIAWSRNIKVYKSNFCPFCGADMRKPPTEEIGDCNVCRFAGCSECDDCVDENEWVREVKGIDYDYEEQDRLYKELADMGGEE